MAFPPLKFAFRGKSWELEHSLRKLRIPQAKKKQTDAGVAPLPLSKAVLVFLVCAPRGKLQLCSS